MKKKRLWAFGLLALLGGCDTPPCGWRQCGSPCLHLMPKPVDDRTLLSTYHGSALGRRLSLKNQLIAAHTLQNLLQTGNVNEEVSWENGSKEDLDDITQEAHGTFIIFNPTIQGWASCLDYKQTLTAQERTLSAHGTACRQDQGIWRITREIPYQVR